MKNEIGNTCLLYFPFFTHQFKKKLYFCILKIRTTMELKESLKQLVFSKTLLKQQVFTTTKEAFELFRHTAAELIDQFQKQAHTEGKEIMFDMHSNVFEFSRDHQVMKSPYIHEDPRRSYCGVIRIYNFLSDSFVYQRDQDLGYMIGRVFVNVENHYFIEGKRELGMLYNNFNTSLITNESVQSIVESAIEYTTNFDLLTPPYDEVKMVSVGEMRNDMDKKTMATGKRLGFRFQADTD